MMIRKKTKRKVAFLQVFVLLFMSMFTEQNTISAVESAKIYADEIVGTQGETIQIPVKISGNTGFMGFKISVKYDERYLLPVETRCGDIISGVFDDNIAILADSTFDVMYSGTGNCNTDGTLFYLSFKVKENAIATTTKLNLSYSQEDTFDESYEDVNLNCNDINVKIEGDPLATNEPTQKPALENCYVVSGEKQEAKAGDEISIPVDISGNQGMAGFIICISYDEKLLIPLSVEKGEVIPVGTTFDNNCTTATGNTFKVLWSGTENNCEDGCLFNLNFKVKEELPSVSTAIDISYLKNETFDEKYNDVTLNCKPISIEILGNPDVTMCPTVTPTSTPTEEPTVTPAETPTNKPTVTPTGTPTNRPTVTPTPTEEPTPTPTILPEEKYVVFGRNVEISSGSEFSIPIGIKNNMGIMGFCMNVTYDASKIEPVSVEKGKLIPNGTVFDDTCMSPVGNTYKILWAGVNEISTDGCLFILNFKAKDNATSGKTWIKVSYSQPDTFDEEYKEVKLNCKEICVEITGTPSPTPTEKPTNSNNVTSNATNGNNNTKPTTLTSPKPAKVKILQVKSKAKKQIYVKWKKQKKIAGYEIQYATSKKFGKKKVKILKSSQYKVTLKKLKSKKYYYIRVRSYSKYGGKKVYGKWSTIKKCKTK